MNFSPKTVIPPLASAPNFSDSDLLKMVPNAYFDRRQKITPCSWWVIVGVELETLSNHVFGVLLNFKILAHLQGFSRADIAEGLLLILGHDRIEPLTADKNIYSTQFLTIDDDRAMHVLEDGIPLSEHNLKYFHDYEDGKKNFHSDPRLNAICLLAKDADNLERVHEQIEHVARNNYPRRRWERPDVQEECQYKYDHYNYDVTRRWHKALMDYGEAGFDDAFLRLPNTIKDGTHNKYSK